jgi:hypothetical protein
MAIIMAILAIFGFANGYYQFNKATSHMDVYMAVHTFGYAMIALGFYGVIDRMKS